MAWFIRVLYLRFSRGVSNRESFSATFIPLTITIVLVITVVKSSLALSLGLVGALSIVRFRAAIKDPEELIYLFFCIAVGLALGAGRWLEAVCGLFVFTCFILAVYYIGIGRMDRHQNLLITVSGNKKVFFDGDTSRPSKVIDNILGAYQIQRFEYDNNRIELRATVRPENDKKIPEMIAALEKKLPGCQISYVNLSTMI